MSFFLSVVIGLAGAFIGFAIGRISDKIGGHWNGPHHWVYGLLLFAAGFFFTGWPGVFLIGFGAGHFISDLEDFLYGRFWGVDSPHEWRFWSIK